MTGSQKRKLKKYVRDVSVFGADAYYGPLTEAEQRALDAQHAAPVAVAHPAAAPAPASASMPWWQWAFLGVGGLAVVAGVASLISDRGGRRSRA